jgi:hypothetical protein
MNFPREAFERYVRAMPQSEAQTALIFLVNFLAEEPTDLSPACAALMNRGCEDCES